MSGTLNGGAGVGTTGGNPPGNPIGGVSGPTGTNNSVVATFSAGGIVSVPVGATQTLSVTFTSSDGNAITGFGVSGSLSTLPAGWSGPSTFACATVATGSGCVLKLTYAPVAAGSGTLTLDYVFVNNAGTPNTRGSSGIPYVATTHDNVVGTPSQNLAAIYIGGTTSVSVTFTTDDGYVASSLLVTAGLTTLPAGWSGASSFLCAAVSTGNACQLNLTYAPTVLASGTLSLTYSYLDNSGTAKAGSVDIPYAATNPHLYVTQLLGGGLSYCPLNSDGTLASCASTGIGIPAGDGTTGIEFNGSSFAYVADYDGNAVYLCNVALDGSLSGCASVGSNFNSPWQLAINGSTLYSTNAAGGVTICAIAADGTLSGCAQSLATGPAAGIAVTPAFAYIGAASTEVDVCAVGAAGSLSGCVATGSGFLGLNGITLSGSFAYAANTANGTVSSCTINAVDGTLSACVASSVGTMPMDVVINGNQAYVDDTDGNVYLCAIGVGTLATCAPAIAGAPFSLPIQIAIH